MDRPTLGPLRLEKKPHFRNTLGASASRHFPFMEIPMPFFAGLDGGSVSVKLAVVNDRGELVACRYVRHRGRPLETARALLAEALDAWPGLALTATGSTGRLAARRLEAPAVNEMAACAVAASLNIAKVWPLG